MPSRVAMARQRMPAISVSSEPWSTPGTTPATSGLRGPISEIRARSAVSSLTSASTADVVGLEVPPGRVEAGFLGVQQVLVGRRSQHPKIGLDVPLAVEQGRVAALAGLQLLDLVCHLALQVLARLGAAHRQPPAARAVQQPAFLAQLPVLRVELDCGRCAHPPDSTRGGVRQFS